MLFIPANESSRIWKHGFIKINAIDNVDSLGGCSGYMSKDLDDTSYDVKKRYFSSKGLYEPEVMKSINSIDLGEFTEEHNVYETSFENEYTGVIYYRQYNLKRTTGQKRRY